LLQQAGCCRLLPDRRFMSQGVQKGQNVSVSVQNPCVF